MGFHICEYIERDEASQLGLRYATLCHSSGDVTLTFTSGRSWKMPHMILLYVELGWVPPKDFIDDVMNSTLGATRCEQYRSTTFESEPTHIGYLNPKDTPIEKPFKINNGIPKGFLCKLEEYMQVASHMRFRLKGEAVSSLIPAYRPY